MSALPTPKPTRKAEALARAPPTIASSCEENAALRKWHVHGYDARLVLRELREVEKKGGEKKPFLVSLAKAHQPLGGFCNDFCVSEDLNKRVFVSTKDT